MNKMTTFAGSLALVLGYFILPILEIAQSNIQIVPLYGLRNIDLVIFSVTTFIFAIICIKACLKNEKLSKALFAFLLLLSVLYLCSFFPAGYGWSAIPSLAFILTVLRYRYSLVSGLTALMLVPFLMLGFISYFPKKDFTSSAENIIPELTLKESAPKNIFIFMLDGSDISSFGLGHDSYPRRDLFPVFGRLVAKDFEWFPMAFSNGSYTDISLKLMFTGISDLKEADKVYQKVNPLFSSLSQKYKPYIYQFRNYYKNFCETHPFDCYPFTGKSLESKFKGLSVLLELYLHRLSLNTSKMSFQTGLDFKPEDLTFLRLLRVAEDITKMPKNGRNFFYFHGFNRTFEQQLVFERELNILMNVIKAKDWYDDSLILFVSDHGIDFTQDGYMYGAYTNHNDITFKVPLAIKWPKKFKRGIRNEVIQNLDIFPTIMHSVFEEKGLEKFKIDGADLNKIVPQWREIQMYCNDKGEVATLEKDFTISKCRKRL